MKSYNKTRISVSLILLVNIIIVLVVLSTNNIFAQNLHNRTLYEIVKQKSNLDKNPQIDVGIEPTAIGIHERTNKVYVANRGSDSISVISGNSNTKIKDIPVGNYPAAIEVNPLTDKVYVTNFNSANISVISTATDKWIKDIPVGDNPSDIGIDEYRNRIYVVNQGSDTISVIENDTNIGKDIPVGNEPYAIGIIRDDLFRTKLYVAHFFSNNISVIDAENYTKIGKDIPVGEKPVAISTDEFANRDLIFVANSFSNNITIIEGATNTKIDSIPVGEMPMDVDIVRPNLSTSKLYVANSASNNISVIDENGMIKYVRVGKSPVAIGINERTNTVYVTNLFSNGVSVIDGISNKVVAGVKFEVYPFNSGYIECEGLISPISQYFYVFPTTECTAKTSKGFEFLSWEENLKDNSTQIINITRPTSVMESTWKSIKNLFNINSDEPEAKLKITKFGTFTANFKELPPPIPSEYLVGLFGIVASTIVGWSIPSIISGIKSSREISKLNYYHKIINTVYDDGKLNEKDIESLDKLKVNISDTYAKGKLNEEHYSNIKNEISILYQEIFKKQFDSIKNLSNSQEKNKFLNKLKSDVDEAFSKEKINEKHYNLLKEKISEFENAKNKKENGRK